MYVLNIAVCGGDEGTVRLCALLRGDGHRVRTFALDGAKLPEGVKRFGCEEGCLDGAEVAVLPLPAADAEGRLWAPLCRREISVTELLAKIPEGALVCAGGTDSLPEGRYVEDYAAREEFAVGEAALAAEGALELAMGATDTAIWRSQALVVGCGRLGRLLADRLRGLGAHTAVAARREGELAMTEAMGFEAVNIARLEGTLGRFDYIFNTVPAPVLNTGRLAEIRAGAFMAELASPPGGFDVKKAEELGIQAVSAPGLAARRAPQTAAELMYRAVRSIIDEWEI